jgi:hypothetical protein
MGLHGLGGDSGCVLREPPPPPLPMSTRGFPAACSSPCVRVRGLPD